MKGYKILTKDMRSPFCGNMKWRFSKTYYMKKRDVHVSKCGFHFYIKFI